MPELLEKRLISPTGAIEATSIVKLEDCWVKVAVGWLTSQHENDW